MKYFFIILLLGAFNMTAQNTSTVLLENESIAVLTELPYEWCLVSMPCGDGMLWVATLKYEIVYPIKDTILVQVICPYRRLKNIKTGILVKLKLVEKKDIDSSKSLNTYLNYIAPTYKLAYLKKGFIWGAKKKGIQRKSFYEKKYRHKVQEHNNNPCACCELVKPVK